ncbi:MAG: hypothetical protein R2816_07135 [Flavobacteriaceae bacterium]|nr:hypothetical protein [Flavobacteriaceae bacterium]
MKNSHLILAIVSVLVISSCGSSKSAKVDPFIGAWSLLIEDTPQGDVSSTLTIFKNESGEYTGNLNSDLGSFNLNNFQILDNRLSGAFVVQDIDFDLIGNFEETLFKGFVSGMGADFKANGKKIVSD